MTRKVLAGVIALFAALSANASDQNWNAEQLGVIRFLESLPQTYASGDLTNYMDLYHEGYTNWYMTTDKVHNHAEITEVVQRSHEAGIRILDFRVTPITIEVEGDKAFVRYVEEEMALNDEGAEEWSKYHFAATLVRTDGRWQFWRTNFFRVPEES